nr:MAG TPA: hypothetical protein [Caudoviricetes sp.]
MVFLPKLYSVHFFRQNITLYLVFHFFYMLHNNIFHILRMPNNSVDNLLILLHLLFADIIPPQFHQTK